MKICIKCNLEKDVLDFTKNLRNKDGLESICKVCRSLKIKENYYLKKEEINKKRREEYNLNVEEINKKRRNKYQKNKKEILEKQKEYKNNNEEYQKKYKEYQKEYQKSVKYKEYKIKNKDKIKEYEKEYRKKSDVRKRINKQSIERNKIRKIKDPIFKLKVSIRSSISNNFRRNGFKKSLKTEEIIGCSFIDFKLYLESKFENWMNWGNKGLYSGDFKYGWDIDHIIPLSSADTEEDLISLNHYTNLQPLCSKINREIKRDLNEY